MENMLHIHYFHPDSVGESSNIADIVLPWEDDRVQRGSSFFSQVGKSHLLFGPGEYLDDGLRERKLYDFSNHLEPAEVFIKEDVMPVSAALALMSPLKYVKLPNPAGIPVTVAMSSSKCPAQITKALSFVVV